MSNPSWSDGALQLQPTVDSWYRLPPTYAYYKNLASPPSGQGDTSQQQSDCRDAVAQHVSLDTYQFVILMYNQDTGMHNHAESPGKFDYLRPWGVTAVGRAWCART